MNVKTTSARWSNKRSGISYIGNFFPERLSRSNVEGLCSRFVERDTGRARNERGTNERDAGLDLYILVSTNEREKRFLRRCTIITAIWRAYETLASGNPKIRGIRRHFHERWGRFHSECILNWEPTRYSSRTRRALHTYANLYRLIFTNNIIRMIDLRVV